MKTTVVKIGDIKENPNNPRTIKDDNFKKLVKSIKDFPKMLEIRPIVVNDEMIVLGGNQRLKACKDAGLKEIPVIKASDLTEEEQRKFIIKDNVSSGDWDLNDLEENWDKDELDEWGFILKNFDVIEDEDISEKDNQLVDGYSNKIGKVTYEPKNTNHTPEDLFVKESKFDSEIDKIENESLRELFKLRAAFFTEFNFSRIADYYAYQASAEEKVVFEKLALVLLDKNQLMENGFTDLINEIDNFDY
jgi:hypothetical protein